MNESEFFTELCGRFGWLPTPWRLAVFAEWHRLEGMPLDKTWNPLATTRLSAGINLNKGFDIGYGPGNWNSVPVRVYATPQDGIQATFETLSLDYYPNVRRCFTDQKGYPEAVPEFVTYIGSAGYAQSLVDFMNATPAGAPPAATTLADVVKALGGDAAVADWNKKGNSLLLGYALEQQKLAQEIQDRIGSAVIEVIINGVKVPLTR